MRTLLLAILLLTPALTVAQIYKTTDAKGNVSYSDTPPASGPAEEIKLRQTNSAPPPDIAETYNSSPATDSDPEPLAVNTDYAVSIDSPQNETTIPMGPGNFSVSASVEPPLVEGAQLQLYVDGSPSGPPQANGSWALTNVFRGAHDLTVTVVDGGGSSLAESAAVRVYVLRPSVNN